MPPADYNKMFAEWTTLAGYRAAFGANPAAKLNEWATNNNFDYARLIPKNTEVRKIAGVDAQVKYCNDKAAEAKAKMNGGNPAPVVPVPAVVKHAASCKCAKCKPTNTIVEKPVDTTAVPNDFNGVITSIINIQNKLKMDLTKARDSIVVLEANNHTMNLELQALKLETAQLPMLQPPVTPKPDVVCDICTNDCSDGYRECDYDTDGVDIACTTCWAELEQNTAAMAERPASPTPKQLLQLLDKQDDDEPPVGCKCGNNTEFDSDLIYGDVACFVCEDKVCEDCTFTDYPDMNNVMCKECAVMGGYMKEEVVESTEDESEDKQSTKSESTEDESTESD